MQALHSFQACGMLTISLVDPSSLLSEGCVIMHDMVCVTYCDTVCPTLSHYFFTRGTACADHARGCVAHCSSVWRLCSSALGGHSSHSVVVCLQVPQQGHHVLRKVSGRSGCCIMMHCMSHDGWHVQGFADLFWG